MKTIPYYYSIIYAILVIIGTGFKHQKELFFTKYLMITKQKNRPRCKHCKISLVRPNGTSKHGFQLWHKYCVECSKALYSEKHKHLINKTTQCQQCSFQAIEQCQLDLVYKDGNKSNKEKENLLTLCANCSRIYKKQLRTEKKSIFNITVDNTDFRI